MLQGVYRNEFQFNAQKVSRGIFKTIIIFVNILFIYSAPNFLCQVYDRFYEAQHLFIPFFCLCLSLFILKITLIQFIRTNYRYASYIEYSKEYEMENEY